MPRLDLFWWGDALRKAGIADRLKDAADAGELEVTVGQDGLLSARRALTSSGWRVVSVRAHAGDEGYSVLARRRRCPA